MRAVLRAVKAFLLADHEVPSGHKNAVAIGRCEELRSQIQLIALFGFFSTATLATAFWNDAPFPLVIVWGGIQALMAVAPSVLARVARHVGSGGSGYLIIYGVASGAALGATLAMFLAAANPGESVVLCVLTAASMCVCALAHSAFPAASMACLLPISFGACIGLTLSPEAWSASAVLLIIICVFVLQRLALKSARSVLAGLINGTEPQNNQDMSNTSVTKADGQTFDGVWRTDADGRLVEWSQSFAQLTGAPAKLLENASFLALFAPASARALGALLVQRAPFHDEIMHFQIDTIEGWWRVSGQPMTDGGWRGGISDFTQTRETEARIAYASEYDSLTDLPNRSMLIRQLGTSLEAAGLSGENVALFVIDLDHFKMINDTQGHPSGDEYLKVIAGRLKDTVGEHAFLARLGGDEFAVIYPQMDPDEASEAAELIVDALLAPAILNGREVLSSGSLGIALAPEHGLEPAILMKHAELALYRAKAQGRGCVRFYDAGMEQDARIRADLEADLRNALATEAMELFFQPLVNTHTQRISGYETLLRWKRPGHGLVSPATFISCAEETGFIVPLGEWVIRRAISEAAQWNDNICVAINLSPAQMKNPALLPTVIGALNASQLDPRRLEIEIVESVLMDETENNIRTLHALRALGVKIALDDFGTGYSSLSYLCAFPFDKIKIDQRFVRDIETSKENQAIVRAIISLARDLNMRVTAEGVENVEQADMLSRLGCAEVQGYLYSRPVPASELKKKDATAGSENVISIRRRA